MDLKQYFKKIRDVENTIAEQYPVIASLETADGGRSGVLTEVSRTVAAKMIVDGRAVIASDEQRAAYLARMQAIKLAAEKLELAKRVQVAIIADSDLRQSVLDTKSSDSGSRK
jgi:hypothetical protein